MRQPDLKTFVEGFFAQLGADGHEDVPGVMRYEIPLARRGDLNAATVRVTFDPSLVERYDNVDLLGPGSLLLDRMLDLAGGRGHYCTSAVTNVKPKPPGEVLEANLTFSNAEAEILSSETNQAPYFLFSFRLTMVTDERTELLEQILLSSRSLREHPMDDVYLDDSLPPSGESTVDSEGLRDAYFTACATLEKRVASAVGKCRDNANRRLDEEMSRIKDYFEGLTHEILESKYLVAADSSIKTLRAEEEKRLQEARLKYRLDARSKLVGVRMVQVPTTSLSVRLQGPGRSKDITVEYDEIAFRIPPPSCESCGSEIVEVTLCSGGHIVCAGCGHSCAFCGHVSCQVCDELEKVSQKCAHCGRLVCAKHAIKEDFGLGVYCPDHVVDCPICGRKASSSFVARCRQCNQKYCFLCVAARSRSCGTCRSLRTVSENDWEVVSARSQSVFPGKFGKWRKGKNRLLTVVEGKSLLSRRTYVLDGEGRLVWEG